MTGTAIAAQENVPPPQARAAADQLLRAGISRFDSEQIVSAADAFRQILERNPSYAEAHIGLGEALMWLGAYDQAAERFARARALRARGSRLDLLESQLAVRTGDFAAARASLDAILRREPYNESARVSRAVMNLAQGATDTALRELQELEQRYPENRQLLSALIELAIERNNDDLIARYLALALQYHSDSASIQLIAARRALTAGQFETASFHARNATARAPQLEEAWLILARAAEAGGDAARARAHYEELIRIDPQNHRAWYARGVMMARTGDTDGAIQSWERVLRLRPDYELARIALENLAIEVLPFEDPQRASLAQRYRTSGRALQNRFLSRQAERHFRRGLQLNPFDPVLREQLAELYLQRGMEGRYVQELRVLTSFGADTDPAAADRDDRIALYDASRRDAVATRWGIDQFTAPRPRTRLTIFSRQSTSTLEPDAAGTVGTYLASLLSASQSIEIGSVRPTPASRSAVVSDARADEADILAVFTVELTDRRVVLALELIDPATAALIAQATIVREGNDRIDGVVREAATRIDSFVVPRGYVLDRDFERVAISLGSVDGVSADQEISLLAEDTGVEIASGTVVALDDLVAEVELAAVQPDTLTVGDIAVAVQPEPDGTDAVTPEEPTDGEGISAPDDTLSQTTRMREIVQQLFTLR